MGLWGYGFMGYGVMGLWIYGVWDITEHLEILRIRRGEERGVLQPVYTMEHSVIISCMAGNYSQRA